MNEVDLSPAEQEGIGSMEGDEKIVHSEGPTTVNLTAPLRCRRSGAPWPRPPPHRCKYRHALYKPRDPHRADARPCTRTPSGARTGHRVHGHIIVRTRTSSRAQTRQPRARARHRVRGHGAAACTRTSFGVHAHAILCADGHPRKGLSHRDLCTDTQTHTETHRHTHHHTQGHAQ